MTDSKRVEYEVVNDAWYDELPATEPPASADVDAAMAAWDRLTPAEQLAAHQDDSYGACLICREWVPHTDDETVLVAFPCPPVRLARAESAATLDVERLARAMANEWPHDLGILAAAHRIAAEYARLAEADR